MYNLLQEDLDEIFFRSNSETYQCLFLLMNSCKKFFTYNTQILLELHERFVQLMEEGVKIPVSQ